MLSLRTSVNIAAYSTAQNNLNVNHSPDGVINASSLENGIRFCPAANVVIHTGDASARLSGHMYLMMHLSVVPLQLATIP